MSALRLGRDGRLERSETAVCDRAACCALKLAPALALAGPSHLSCAGPVLPGIELSDREAPGVGAGISFATGACAEAGACGGGGPPRAVSSCSFSALNCTVWRAPVGR